MLLTMYMHVHVHVHHKLFIIIIWQSKSERSDWFFLGRDFAIRTVSVEMVISCVFFVFESRQIQNKHGPNAI